LRLKALSSKVEATQYTLSDHFFPGVVPVIPAVLGAILDMEKRK
jgi:hypothetical protein